MDASGGTVMSGEVVCMLVAAYALSGIGSAAATVLTVGNGARRGAGASGTALASTWAVVVDLGRGCDERPLGRTSPMGVLLVRKVGVHVG